jgi:hypothetical protein
MIGDTYLTGSHPFVTSRFAAGTAAQVSIVTASMAAATIWRHRGGRRRRCPPICANLATLSLHFARVHCSGSAGDETLDQAACHKAPAVDQHEEDQLERQ